MTLTDGDIAALARQAVDQRDPDADVHIVPADPVDPYRWASAAWTVTVGGRSSYISSAMTSDEALAKLVADLNQ